MRLALLALLAGAGAGAGAGSLEAQRAVVTGVVWRGGPRPGPLAAAWVVLHRVAMSGGAAVDSVRSDARGRFHLAVSRPDTSAIYLVSTWHGGVAYFSAPLPLPPHGTRSADTLFVWDTTSVGPPFGISRRLLTVARPKRDGTRDVLEIIELNNADTRTRVAPDTLRPTWAGAIPRDAIQFQAGQGDFSAQAVTRRGDSELTERDAAVARRHETVPIHVEAGARQPRRRIAGQDRVQEAAAGQRDP